METLIGVGTGYQYVVFLSPWNHIFSDYCNVFQAKHLQRDHLLGPQPHQNSTRVRSSVQDPRDSLCHCTPYDGPRREFDDLPPVYSQAMGPRFARSQAPFSVRNSKFQINHAQVLPVYSSFAGAHGGQADTYKLSAYHPYGASTST